MRTKKSTQRQKAAGGKTAMLNAKEKLERLESGGGATSVPAMIAQLGELHRQGVLTDAEFQQKKAQLLAKM